MHVYCQWRNEGDRGFGLFKPLPQIPRALKNRAKRNPIVKAVTNCWIWEANTPRYSEKGSKILKLLPVRNCFTLAMTNKLVVIINSLKVPKIKKILLYETKFLLPNYSCLQNPWLGGCRRQIPFSLSSVLNWICWTLPPLPNKTPGYATVYCLLIFCLITCLK